MRVSECTRVLEEYDVIVEGIQWGVSESLRLLEEYDGGCWHV